jgi:hypothetical protein
MAGEDYSDLDWLYGSSTPTYQQPAQTVWNPWGSGDNIWNSSGTDGSVPWDVSMQLGLPPGAQYGAGMGGSGSSSRLYANTGSDAFLNSALSRLQSVVSGQNLPFDQTTRSNLLSGASDMNAAAEASNAEDMRARVASSGGSLTDPAAQAALARLKSTRQQGNASAAQAIDSQANQANFAAQQNAAGALSSTRLNQAQIDPYYNGAPHQFTGTTWGSGGGTGGAASPNAGTTSTGVPTTIDPNTGRPPVGAPGFNSLIPPYIQTPNYGWQTGTQGVTSNTYQPFAAPVPKPTTTTTQPAQTWQPLQNGSTINLTSTAPGTAQSYQQWANQPTQTVKLY